MDLIQSFFSLSLFLSPFSLGSVPTVASFYGVWWYTAQSLFFFSFNVFSVCSFTLSRVGPIMSICKSCHEITFLSNALIFLISGEDHYQRKGKPKYGFKWSFWVRESEMECRDAFHATAVVNKYPTSNSTSSPLSPRPPPLPPPLNAFPHTWRLTLTIYDLEPAPNFFQKIS